MPSTWSIESDADRCKKNNGEKSAFITVFSHLWWVFVNRCRVWGWLLRPLECADQFSAVPSHLTSPIQVLNLWYHESYRASRVMAVLISATSQWRSLFLEDPHCCYCMIMKWKSHQLKHITLAWEIVSYCLLVRTYSDFWVIAVLSFSSAPLREGTACHSAWVASCWGWVQKLSSSIPL